MVVILARNASSCDEKCLTGAFRIKAKDEISKLQIKSRERHYEHVE